MSVCHILICFFLPLYLPLYLLGKKGKFAWDKLVPSFMGEGLRSGKGFDYAPCKGWQGVKGQRSHHPLLFQARGRHLCIPSPLQANLCMILPDTTPSLDEGLMFTS